MEKNYKIRLISLICFVILFILNATCYYSYAGKVEPDCSKAKESGNTIVVPIKVESDKDEMIMAWGLDIEIKGLEYVKWIKEDCLAGASESFMCNQLSNGMVRCGSYTGNLNLKGKHTLFKLVLKKKPEAKESSIKLLNFVDHLADVKQSECKLK